MIEVQVQVERSPFKGGEWLLEVLREMRSEFLQVAFMAWRSIPLWSLWILSPDAASIGLFHLGTPVRSRARDPWQTRALACVLRGDRSLLEMSWLFSEMYTCAFGLSLAYYSLHLQCVYFILRCHVERAWALGV